MIRKLAAEDTDIVKKMKTGIEGDYVLRILHKLIEDDHILGYFEKGKLVGIAGMSIYENECAVLGRLRTHVEYRGRSIASKLMNHLRMEALENPNIVWTGYATEATNIAGNRLASSLSMNLEAVIVSTRISPGIVNGTNAGGPYRFEPSTKIKKKVLEIECAHLEFPFFPYSIYYPLPYVPDLTQLYLDNIELYTSKTGNFVIMREDKGASYLHLKVWNGQTLHCQEMWRIVNFIAQKEDRTIWVDLPKEQAYLFKTQSNQTIWHLYGQKRSEYYEMD
ncbi:MAG: GNAT family N-acetyltransferase [Anaerobacillus sp.]